MHKPLAGSFSRTTETREEMDPKSAMLDRPETVDVHFVIIIVSFCTSGNRLRILTLPIKNTPIETDVKFIS